MNIHEHFLAYCKISNVNRYNDEFNGYGNIQFISFY